MKLHLSARYSFLWRQNVILFWGTMCPSKRLPVPEFLAARRGQLDMSSERCWVGAQGNLCSRERVREHAHFPPSLLFASHLECRRWNPAAILDHEVTLKIDSNAKDHAEREKEPGTLMTWWSQHSKAGCRPPDTGEGRTPLTSLWVSHCRLQDFGTPFNAVFRDSEHKGSNRAACCPAW